MPLAKVVVVGDAAIIAAVISLWNRGEISDEVFEKSVGVWKTKGIVPIDWTPVKIGGNNEA